MAELSFTELESAAESTKAAESQTTTAEATKAAEVAAEAEKPQFTEADVQSYRQLVDMGITVANAAEYKQAKVALENLPVILRSNADMFFDEIQKSDPALHDALLERVSDRWYNQKGRHIYEKQQNGSGSRTAESAPTEDPRITQMQQTIAGLVAERNQEKTLRQQEVITDGFNKSIGGLLAKLPEGTSEGTKDHIRLKTQELIWKDSPARERAAKGVFIDVPTHFAKASRLVTAETKTASKEETARRTEVEANGRREVTAAAENVNGTAPGEDKDIWGEKGMMRDVEKAFTKK